MPFSAPLLHDQRLSQPLSNRDGAMKTPPCVVTCHDDAIPSGCVTNLHHAAPGFGVEPQWIFAQGVLMNNAPSDGHACERGLMTQVRPVTPSSPTRRNPSYNGNILHPALLRRNESSTDSRSGDQPHLEATGLRWHPRRPTLYRALSSLERRVQAAGGIQAMRHVP